MTERVIVTEDVTHVIRVPDPDSTVVRVSDGPPGRDGTLASITPVWGPPISADAFVETIPGEYRLEINWTPEVSGPFSLWVHNPLPSDVVGVSVYLFEGSTVLWGWNVASVTPGPQTGAQALPTLTAGTTYRVWITSNPYPLPALAASVLHSLNAFGGFRNADLPPIPAAAKWSLATRPDSDEPWLILDRQAEPAPTAVGVGSIQVGGTATGNYSTTVGQASLASSNAGTALGRNAQATANYAVALGNAAVGDIQYAVRLNSIPLRTWQASYITPVFSTSSTIALPPLPAGRVYAIRIDGLARQDSTYARLQRWQIDVVFDLRSTFAVLGSPVSSVQTLIGAAPTSTAVTITAPTTSGPSITIPTEFTASTRISATAIITSIQG